VTYARSIPVSKARADVLLVYKMNGSELPSQHVFLFGHCARMVRNGLGQMVAARYCHRQAIHRLLSDLDYAYWRRRGDIGELTPVAEMQIKAEIAKPAQGETVPVNSNVRVHGAAWTSDSEIAKVEVSTDGGSIGTRQICLVNRKQAPGILGIRLENPQRAGKANVVARATDSLGQTQPVRPRPGPGHLHD